MTPEREEREPIAVLRSLGRDVPESDPAARERARARLQRSIEAERVRPRHAVPWAAAAAAILVVVLAAVIVVDIPATRRGGERLLIRLASVAASRPAASIPAGSFAYLSARVASTETSASVEGGPEETVVVREIRETWVAQDGSGLIIELPLSGAGQETRYRAGAGDLRFADLDGLPTEPAALLEAIRGEGLLDEPDDDLEILSGVGALLRDSYVSAAHRRALFEVVRSLDGVEVSDGYRDPEGRSGIAVSLSDGERSVTLVFDPETSRLLFQRETRTDGTFLEATYLSAGVVPAAGERPSGIAA